MNLDRVTITGADDGTDISDLVRLSNTYPWAEWGILLSRRSEGLPRFPSLDWIERLRERATRERMMLSAHLCGAWVRRLCKGDRMFEDERPSIARMFQRAQLNFHACQHEVDAGPFVEALRSWGRDEYIFQFDTVNDSILEHVRGEGLRCVPLFDASGGAGVEPGTWPSAELFEYAGYAGGLHPDKIGEQLLAIEEAAHGRRIWIDVETHVRSDSYRHFDIRKVEQFLSAVAPTVRPNCRP